MSWAGVGLVAFAAISFLLPRRKPSERIAKIQLRLSIAAFLLLFAWLFVSGVIAIINPRVSNPVMHYVLIGPHPGSWFNAVVALLGAGGLAGLIFFMWPVRAQPDEVPAKRASPRDDEDDGSGSPGVSD